MQSRRTTPKLPAHIKSLIRREETIKRYALFGDNWHMTWAHDDRQYTGLRDGYAGGQKLKGLYNR